MHFYSLLTMFTSELPFQKFQVVYVKISVQAVNGGLGKVIVSISLVTVQCLVAGVKDQHESVVHSVKINRQAAENGLRTDIVNSLKTIALDLVQNAGKILDVRLLTLNVQMASTP